MPNVTKSPRKRYCRACSRDHPESAFEVVRDGVRLKTAICAKSIAVLSTKYNREQAVTKHKRDDERNLEWLLRKSIEEAKKRRRSR